MELTLNPCACGSGTGFQHCCGPLIDGRQPADSALALMRSRFTAFARREADYLLYSWHPAHRPSFVELDDQRTWTGLEIVQVVAGGVKDRTGQVGFIARFDDDGAPGSIRELSRFERYDGRWVYLDGVVLPS